MVESDEILTNGHAGMLNDTHRHSSYRSAIRNAVRKLHDQSQSIRLLDIGTGTGLLALYAAEAGAEFIVACECNTTMACIAKEVFKQNKAKYSDSCTIVVEEMSSCMLDKANSEYRNSFNIIVSEVYDSELLGEGCLITYKHALENLASNSCIFIPLRATLFAQPVFLPALENYCSLPDFGSHSNNRKYVSFDQPWEVHIDKIHDLYVEETTKLWQWDFNVKSFKAWTGNRVIEVSNSKSCNGLLVWWKSDIDDHNSISIAPRFHPDFEEFREHWMPLLYFLCPKSGDFNIYLDVTDLQIQISHSSENISKWRIDSNISPEMAHHRYIGFMNCAKLNEAYCNHIEELVKLDCIGKNNIVYIGPPSILPQLISHTIKRKVKTLEDQRLDKIENLIIVDSCYHPFCLTSLSYFYKRQLLEQSQQSLTTSPSLVPSKVVLFVTLVESSQLWNKVVCPENVDEFNISCFSEQVKDCLRNLTGEDMFEPIHLWEYDYNVLSQPLQLPPFPQYSRDFKSTISITEKGTVTNAIFLLGFYFGESLVQFDDNDYFNKVDCYTFVDKLEVFGGDKVCLEFKLRDSKIERFSVTVKNMK